MIWIGILLVLCQPEWVSAQELTQQVMSFDGRQTCLELPSGAFDRVREGTIEAWVKWEKFNKWARVFDFGREENAMVVQTEKTSSSLNFAFWDRDGKRHRIQAKNAVRTGVWYHVATVFGRSGMAFYLDGEGVGTNAFEGKWPSSGCGTGVFQRKRSRTTRIGC